MNRNPVIRRLFAILVVAGLALAPVSRPVMAETSSGMAHSDLPHAGMSMPAMSDDMAAAAMPHEMAGDEMAGDMPCCPSKAPMPLGCDKCIFMAACMTKCFAALSSAVVEPFLTAILCIASPRNDFRPDGFAHPPPEHPPRTLV